MREVNPEHIAWWFDQYRLKAYIMMEGYINYGVPVARILSCNQRTATDKLNLSRFTHEETLRLAQALHMTKEEYLEIFAKGVFDEKNNPL